MALIAVLAAGVASANPTVAETLVGIGQGNRVTLQSALWFRHEPGVETRVLLDGVVGIDFGGQAQAFGGLSVSALNNPGIAHYGIGGRVVALDPIRLGLQVQANHDEWSDWQIGENRIGAAIFVRPLSTLDLAVGLAWRLPLFIADQYHSPFVWTSEAAELNYLYRVDWTFLRRKDLALGIWVANYDLFTIRNPAQIPFGVSSGCWAGHHCWLSARLGSDIKGLSGLLLSLGELDGQVGVLYAF